MNAQPSAATLQGPSTMRFLEVGGTSRQIGRSLGEALKDAIREHLSNLPSPWEDKRWLARRDTLVEALRRQAPQSLAEIQGMAEASAVSLDALLWLNLEPQYGQPEQVDRCTNIVFADGPDGPVWGKNNDRPMHEKPRPAAACLIRRTGQIPVLVFTYAGVLSTADGMNAQGLTIGHSSVGSVFEQSDHHVPIRLWSYEGLFRCQTTRQFITHMTAQPLRGKGYAMVCVDSSGDAVSLEAPCPLLQVRRGRHPSGHLNCVNLYQLPALAQADRRTPGNKCNAQDRQAWLDGHLEQLAVADVPAMQTILRRDQSPAICRRAVAPDRSITEYSMIGLPRRRQAMFLYGDPGRQEYQVLSFDTPSASPAVGKAASPSLDVPALRDAMHAACKWIQDVAQLKSDELPPDTQNTSKLAHTRWQGAIRGEYDAARKRWHFFCPTWHTGQAVKALTLAAQQLDAPQYLQGAQAGAQFILNQQVWDTASPDHGLLLAYEDIPDQVNTSAVLESMDGLLILAAHTQSDELRQRTIAMGEFLVDRLYMQGMGLFRDLYNPRKHEIGSPTQFRSKDNIGGRPLLDDAILLKLHRLTGKAKFLTAHLEIADRLLADQNPAGNWMDYGPCNARNQSFHPRHTYWWGLPLIDTHQHTGRQDYLRTAIASGEFTRGALRADGGYLRGTYLDFKTDSFGHATSGSACASILFMRLYEQTGDTSWLASAELALRFCMNMQLNRAADPNLRGAILEKVLPPDGSDALPYYLRDLGTIFFVSAGAAYLELIGRR